MLRASVCFAAPPSFPPTEELGKPLKDARVREKRKPYSVVFKLCSKEPSWGSLEELRGQASGDQEKGPARAIAKGGLSPHPLLPPGASFAHFPFQPESSASAFFISE